MAFCRDSAYKLSDWYEWRACEELPADVVNNYVWPDEEYAEKTWRNPWCVGTPRSSAAPAAMPTAAKTSPCNTRDNTDFTAGAEALANMTAAPGHPIHVVSKFCSEGFVGHHQQEAQLHGSYQGALSR